MCIRDRCRANLDHARAAGPFDGVERQVLERPAEERPVDPPPWLSFDVRPDLDGGRPRLHARVAERLLDDGLDVDRGAGDLERAAVAEEALNHSLDAVDLVEELLVERCE